jgi:hypothetical protein
MKLHEIILNHDLSKLEGRLREYVRANAVDFARVLEAHPMKDRTGAISICEAFWLYRLAVDTEPGVIIESGTFRGWSLYFLERSNPGVLQAEVYSFDPGPEEPVQYNKVKYNKWDWTVLAATPIPKCLVFFDDHQDQGRRLSEAAERGVRDVVFHDNYIHPDHSHKSVRFCELPAKAEVCFTFPRLSPAEMGLEGRETTVPYRWLTWIRLKG